MTRTHVPVLSRGQAFARGQLPEWLSPVVEAARPVRLPPPVFPFYILARIRDALSEQYGDTDKIIHGVERNVHGQSIETLGDCRYALIAKDVDGNRYRVTIEVVP